MSLIVNADNFVRAETDNYLVGFAKNGALGTFVHVREPASIEKQDIVRLNRDTLYSQALFDLDAGDVTITLPDAGERYMALQIIDEDHYTHGVEHAPARRVLTKADIGTRYVAALVRTLVDPNDEADLREVRRLQDAIAVTQASTGAVELPAWDQNSLTRVRDALKVLASGLSSFEHAFGARGEVDPLRRLIGAAAGWGGNPDAEAMYIGETPELNDGDTVYRLTVKDVPVDGFWSISVYNAAGYFEPNSRNAYTINSITAQKGNDGSIAIQFGGCDGQTPNCLPVPPGWNYLVRLYRPRAEVREHRWTFPTAQPLAG
ncbi:DUF1254 domain-containing protein [Brevundimonas sp. Root1279]|uniref:DUF1254 domain-containing protein n=1 Tax=Brevundimonas sp. Root1279 TaxID=1736443 RepID=UPI0009EA17DB|nr:DUF1254 domain-containing protein [Brevundimonas sp. Root1279]